MQAEVAGRVRPGASDIAPARASISGTAPRSPGARHQAVLGLGRRRRRLDQRDDLVDVGERDGEAFEDVGALARLAQVEHGAARDDFAAVAQEGLDACP